MTIPSYVIGIAGGTGAGKTTVTHEVTDGLDGAVAHVPLDNYYEDADLPAEERESINYDHPSAFEWELIRTQLERLLEGRAIEMPQYDFTDHRRIEERTRVEPADVVVVEGIFALYDERINEMLDLKLYVETDADVRILRRIHRDVLERGRSLEGVMEQYLSTVKPMHEQFVEPTKKNADLVIPEGANAVAIEFLESAIADARGREPGSIGRDARPTSLLEYDD